MATMLSLTNPVFQSFVFYATASVVKLMLMSVLTSFYRVGRAVYVNPEDLSLDLTKKKDLTIVPHDEVVERVRRNHLNDLENIPAFVFVGLFFLFINPGTTSAIWHFRLFFLSRLLHMISYQMALQPARAICHVTGVTVIMSMAVQILLATFGGL